MKRRSILFLMVLVWARAAVADPNRFALIIGDNRGERDEATLRFAQSDAERLATVLKSLGGFEPQNVTVLAGAGADEVQHVLASIDARARAYPGDSLLLVYYSGHADAMALHLAGTQLPIATLAQQVSASSASARVLVLDACRSGTMTRVKGGTPAPAFDVTPAFAVGAQGVALLSSSAAGESSQESDALGASFFTHALVSALLGAGDANHDGAVTLAEAFAYAREQTLAATSRTLYGPQHPTYRYDLGGREDLVLTRPGAEYRAIGTLAFLRRGFYVVHRHSAEGSVVAEVLVSDDGGRRMALDSGRYFVTRHETDHLEQGRFDVRPQQLTQVMPELMARLDYARVVRKGGTLRHISGSLFAATGLRGSLLGLGEAWQTSIGGRLDLHQFSLELRLGFAQSDLDNMRLDILTREISGAVDAIRAFDLGPLTLNVGLEVGVAGLWQALHDPTQVERRSFGPFVGAVGQLELPLWRRLFVRLELAGLFYFLQVPGTSSGSTMTSTEPTYRVSGGLGVYF
jgi:hypothetical protein